jgi:hypothetical protein
VFIGCRLTPLLRGEIIKAPVQTKQDASSTLRCFVEKKGGRKNLPRV